jgi:hypothetical protein
MSARRVLRIILSLVILAVLWTRAAKEWHDRSGSWLAGMLTISLVLLLVVIVEVTGVQRKWRRQSEEIPKRPLGLDS